ncbi:MAG: hypothetical protein M3463_00150 [Verrucomicrobiota bacterium]|nr:hypothetical protein [Verrucomicrobiota bacterium]
MSAFLNSLWLCFCVLAFWGCGTFSPGVTFRPVSGEWTGRTRLITALDGPQQATSAVVFRTDRPVGRQDYRGGFLVDEKMRMVPHRYAGRILRVRGTMKCAPAIDPRTGLKYDRSMDSDGKWAISLVVVARAKDIVDLGPAN